MKGEGAKKKRRKKTSARGRVEELGKGNSRTTAGIKTEEALKESEERYRATFEQAIDSIVLLDIDTGQILEFNDKAYENLGYTREEFGKLKLSDIEALESSGEIAKHMGKAARDGMEIFETKHKTKDGRIRDVLVSAKIISIRGRKVCQSIFRDITERKKAEETLREQKEMLQTILDNVPVMIAFLDPDAAHKWVNKAWETTLGWSLEETQSRDILKELCPDPQYYKYVVDFIGKAESKWSDFKTRRRDGTVLDTIWTNVPLSDGSNFGIGLDITERKKAEEKLRRGEKQASAAIEAARGFTFNYDISTGKVNWGGAIEEITGYTPEEFAQIDVDGWAKMIHPDDRDRVLSILQEAIQVKDRTTAEYRFRTKKGGYVTLSSISLTEKKDGKAVRLVGILQDITERKKSEERYRTLFESTREGLIGADPDGRVVSANPAAAKTLGYKDSKDLMGMYTAELYEDPKQREVVMKRIAEQGYIEDFEVVVKKKDGTNAYLLISITTEKDEQGNLLRTNGIFRDITERKKADEALLEQKEMLQTILDNIPVMIAFLDPDAAHKWINKAWEKTLGWSLEETQSQDILKEIYPDPEYYRYVVNFIGKAESKWGDFKTRRRDGTVLDTIWTNVPLSDGSNFGIGLDITERKKAEENLQESENLVRRILNATPNPIFAKDRDGRYIFVNKANAELHDTTPEEMVGKTDLDYAHLSLASEQEVERYLADDRMVIDSKQPKFVQAESFTLPDGTTRWFQTAKIPMTLRGNPDCVLGVTVDITERKKAEDALRVERDKAQKYLDVAGVLFVVLDAEQKVSLINQKGCEILGYSEQEIIGKNWFENFVPEQNRFEIRNIFNKLMAGEIEPAEYFENPVLTRDGQERLIAWHNTLLKDPAGNMIGTLSSGQDITERKKAEERLINSETKFRTLFESAGGAIFLTDAETGRVLDCNLQAEKLTGFARDQLIGMRKLDLFPEDKREEYKGQVAYSIDKDSALDLESEIQHKDGRRIPILISTRVIEMEDKDVVMSHFMDITQRKETEAQILQARAELEHTTRLITVGEMASGLAHELNQPLCAILNYTDSCLRMLKEQTVDSGVLLDTMEQVVAQTNRAGKIIRRIRNLVKKHEPHLSSVGINEIVKEIIDIYEAEAKQNRVIMQTKLAKNMPLIQADRVALEQVLLNLVKNSLEAMSDVEPERRKLTIETSVSDKDEVEVVVRDTGKGLPLENAKEIFESFFTTKPEGLGIGLSLSRSIIEAHHGRIWYEPGPDVGASFKFTLPLKGG